MVDLLSSINTIVLFVLFIIPGLISMQVYRLLMPTKELNWENAIIEGLFYSSVNYGFCLPFLSLMIFMFTVELHPFLFSFSVFFTLAIAPIIWPLVFTKVIRTKKLMKNLQIPFPRAWDFFFDKRVPCFILIHLKNGKLIGGYYGANSYASSYPNDGDIYLELVYKTDKEGRFGSCITNSNGLLIRREDYDYLELFSIPNQKGATDESITKSAEQ